LQNLTIAMKCQIKKGIFVLRTCEEKSFAVCSVCRREVCAAHIDRSSAAQITCVECAAEQFKQQKLLKNNPNLPKDTPHILDDFWYYTTRSSFYSSSHNYRPFDRTDYHSFEQKTGETNQLNDMDNESAGFLDS
jgi:hypothetical protein